MATTCFAVYCSCMQLSCRSFYDYAPLYNTYHLLCLPSTSSILCHPTLIWALTLCGTRVSTYNYNDYQVLSSGDRFDFDTMLLVATSNNGPNAVRRSLSTPSLAHIIQFLSESLSVFTQATTPPYLVTKKLPATIRLYGSLLVTLPLTPKEASQPTKQLLPCKAT